MPEHQPRHRSEVTQTPIEIQLRVLRTTLGDDLVRDLKDSVAPNTWRAYRSDLADFATWVAYTSAEWRAPEVVATYLRTLEDGGAAYATITRRLTSIHKLVAIAAIAAGDLDYQDPTTVRTLGGELRLSSINCESRVGIVTYTGPGAHRHRSLEPRGEGTSGVCTFRIPWHPPTACGPPSHPSAPRLLARQAT